MENGGVRRVTWRTADVARAFMLGILFLFAWRFFWLVHTALFLFLLAILLAIVIHAPAKYLSRWMPFRLSFAISVLLFLGSLGGLFLAIIPEIVQQITVLAIQLPAALDSASLWLQERTIIDPQSEMAQRVSDQALEFVGRFVPVAFNMIGLVMGFFALIVLAIFLAAEPSVYRRLFLTMVPQQSRRLWARAYTVAGRNLRLWVIGKACTMIVVGLAVWIGLTLFKIPGALALGALAAVMEFIPNFGPTIAAAPAIIAAFVISPWTALWVALFYFILQQIQSAITVPLVERRAVDIPPAALLIWQIMLAVGFGFLALFVATPLLAVIVVVVRVVYYEPARARKRWDRRESAAAAKTAVRTPSAPPPRTPPTGTASPAPARRPPLDRPRARE
jgi:predicted PurR-regulated permease PerM